jgi:hypothetical protein
MPPKLRALLPSLSSGTEIDSAGDATGRLRAGRGEVLAAAGAGIDCEASFISRALIQSACPVKRPVLAAGLGQLRRRRRSP